MLRLLLVVINKFFIEIQMTFNYYYYFGRKHLRFYPSRVLLMPLCRPRITSSLAPLCSPVPCVIPLRPLILNTHYPQTGRHLFMLTNSVKLYPDTVFNVSFVHIVQVSTAHDTPPNTHTHTSVSMILKIHFLFKQGYDNSTF